MTTPNANNWNHAYLALRFLMQRANVHHQARARRSFYDVLQIKPSASAKEVKTAYYELSKVHHPDINQQSADSSRRFQEISEAYAVLGNESSRSEYDSKHAMNPLSDHRIFRKSGLRQHQSWAQQSSSNANSEETGWDSSNYRDFVEFQKMWRKRAQKAPTGNSKEYNYADWYKAHYGAKAEENQQWDEAAAFYGSAEAGMRNRRREQFLEYMRRREDGKNATHRNIFWGGMCALVVLLIAMTSNAHSKPGLYAFHDKRPAKD